MLKYKDSKKKTDSKKINCSKSSIHHTIEKFKKHEIYDGIKNLDLVKLHEEMIMLFNELSCDPLLVLVIKYVPIC